VPCPCPTQQHCHSAAIPQGNHVTIFFDPAQARPARDTASCVSFFQKPKSARESAEQCQHCDRCQRHDVTSQIATSNAPTQPLTPPETAQHPAQPVHDSSRLDRLAEGQAKRIPMPNTDPPQGFNICSMVPGHHASRMPCHPGCRIGGWSRGGAGRWSAEWGPRWMRGNRCLQTQEKPSIVYKVSSRL
jgi:hypothetical protein